VETSYTHYFISSIFSFVFLVSLFTYTWLPRCKQCLIWYSSFVASYGWNTRLCLYTADLVLFVAFYINIRLFMDYLFHVYGFLYHEQYDAADLQLLCVCMVSVVWYMCLLVNSYLATSHPFTVPTLFQLLVADLLILDSGHRSSRIFGITTAEHTLGVSSQLGEKRFNCEDLLFLALLLLCLAEILLCHNWCVCQDLCYE
jgi:hypothetical protein